MYVYMCVCVDVYCPFVDNVTGVPFPLTNVTPSMCWFEKYKMCYAGQDTTDGAYTIVSLRPLLCNSLLEEGILVQ